MKLIDWLPSEFQREYMDTPCARLLDYEVTVDASYDHLLYFQCPISMKHIYHWCICTNGIKKYAVAWNENPSKGWSFPIKRIK